MATICYKPKGSCKCCEYHKFDEDDQRMVCTKDQEIKKNKYLIAVSNESRDLLDITDSAPSYEAAMIKIKSEYNHMKYAAIWVISNGVKEIFIRRNKT